MSIVLALAAFAGSMAILSTIVTTIVEFAHKTLLLRLAGLKEMLRALHDGPLSQLGPDPFMLNDRGKASAEAVSFADMMTRTPSTNRRWWYARSIWVIRGILQTEFDRLSTLQFVEQLAQTDHGKRLSQLDRSTLRSELTRIAYQFERYGEAQLDYFRRRAKFLSVIVAFAFVSIANVDALAMFGHFANHQDTARAMVLLADSADTRSATDGSSPASPSGSATGAAAAASEGANTKADRAEAEQVIKDAAQQTLALSAMGMPIGERMFPRCIGFESARRSASLPSRRAASETSSVHLDPRCEEAAPNGLRFFLRPHKIVLGDSAGPSKWIDVSGAWVDVELPRPLAWLPRALFSKHTASWLLGLLCAAGLVGLGAPFWFDLFRSLASVSGVRRPVPVRSEATEAGAGERGRDYGSVMRRRHSSDPDELLRGFLISSGMSPTDPKSPPRGERVGEPSNEAILD